MSASSAQHAETVRELADHIEIESLWLQVTGSSAQPEAALQLLVSSALRLTGADGCAVALPDRADDGRIKCQASAGSAPPVGAYLDVSSGLSGHCVRTGTAVVCDDTAADARVDPEACRALNLKSALIVPVKEGSRVVGVVEVFASRPAAFDAGHARVMEQIAQMAAATRPSAGARVPADSFGESAELTTSPGEWLAAAEPTIHTDVNIESLVARLRREVPPAADVDEQITNVDAKRHAVRVALLSLAAVGAIAIALGSYSAMNSAHRQIRSAALSNHSAAAPERSPSLPQMDTAAVRNKPVSKRSTSARGRDAGSPAVPSADISLAGSSANDTPAMVLPPPSSARTADAPEDVVEEVAPPALNVSHPPLKLSGAVSPPAFPTLSSSAPVEPTHRVPVSAHVDPARLVRKTNPVYPPAALASQIPGTVVLKARVAADGRIDGVDVLRGSSLFTSAAVNAVRQWKYQPAEVDGRAVESEVVITLNFSPQKK